jgi:hypothetical protein
VLLDLQDRYLLVEDEAMQAELQEDQQREADEAAAEEAEEAREEEVRLRRQEHQQQLREAQLRQQQQQQQQMSVGSGPMYPHLPASSYTGEWVFALTLRVCGAFIMHHCTRGGRTVALQTGPWRVCHTVLCSSCLGAPAAHPAAGLLFSSLECGMDCCLM